MRQKTVTMIMHRLNARGGHERSTLEVLTRLSRAGWAVELVAFELDNWPAELPIRFHRVPKWHPPVQLMENMWFACYVFMWSLFRARGERIFVTIGAAAANVDLRIVQFVNSAYQKSVHTGIAHYPNTATAFHRIYQRFYSSFEGWRERRLLPRAKHLIAISNQVRHELQELFGADTPPISIVHHGTDHTPEKVRHLEGAVALTGDVPVTIFAGALERKGVPLTNVCKESKSSPRLNCVESATCESQQ